MVPEACDHNIGRDIMQKGMRSIKRAGLRIEPADARDSRFHLPGGCAGFRRQDAHTFFGDLRQKVPRQPARERIGSWYLQAEAFRQIARANARAGQSSVPARLPVEQRVTRPALARICSGSAFR